VSGAVKAGRVNPQQLVFAGTRASFDETRALVRRVDEARWALEVHRTSQPKASAIDFARRLLEVIDGHSERP
jgi:hypothetical protein